MSTDGVECSDPPRDGDQRRVLRYPLPQELALAESTNEHTTTAHINIAKTQSVGYVARERLDSGRGVDRDPRFVGGRFRSWLSCVTWYGEGLREGR